MSTFPTPSSPEDIRLAAAHWTVRRDRGLSSAEAIEFELWLAADPRHGAAMQRATGSWALLDRVPEVSAQLYLSQATQRRSWWRQRLLFGSLAAAAAITFLVVWSRAPRDSMPPAATALVASGPRVVTLADGTLVRLNEGSEIVEQFTPAERYVRLTRGEAHFTVTKNPARPFIVGAGALRVRAVGTAFNVNRQSARIEVLVTEGRVGVERVNPNALAPSVDQRLEVKPLHLDAGERAVASAAPPAGGAAPEIVVTKVDAAEMTRALAWQDALLRLGGATLAEIVSEFERRTGQHVRLADPALAQLRLGGRFRADDLEGFANLLATTFEIEVERAADGTLVLRKKNPVSR